jgi:hypothetical protein
VDVKIILNLVTKDIGEVYGSDLSGLESVRGLCEKNAEISLP